MHVKYLAEALGQKGHEVHVLHSIDAYRLKRGGAEPPREETSVRTHRVTSPADRMSPALAYATGRNRSAERALENLLREERPALVHHHNVSLLGEEVLRIGALPKLYTAHDYWLLCQRSDLLYRGEVCDRKRCLRCSVSSARPYQFWRRRLLARAVDSVDRIIAPSEFMSNLLREGLGAEPVVMRNFVPRPAGWEGGGETAPHFVFASILERHKGLELLIESFKRQRLDTELHVIGRGSLEPLVRQSERESGGKVRHLGFVPHGELLREIATSLCMVLPSTWCENSPLSCIEALSLGRPLVVSRMGGLPELVRNPECGIACDLTVESIGAALSAIEHDPSLRKRLSENALSRYEAELTPEPYLKKYDDLVKEVLGRAS